MEALKGDSEGEDRGQAVVGCPRFAVLVMPAGCTHAALQVEAWAGFVGLPETLCVGPFVETVTSWWGALLVPGGLGGWRGPHQMIW